jgi:hypothetical protein
MTLGRDGPSLAAAIDHLPLGSTQPDPEDEQSGYQQSSYRHRRGRRAGLIGSHPARAPSASRARDAGLFGSDAEMCGEGVESVQSGWSATPAG